MIYNIKNDITQRGLWTFALARSSWLDLHPQINPSRLDSRSDRPFRPTKSTEDRSNRLLRPTLATEVLRKTLRRAIVVELGSTLLPQRARFCCYIATHSLERADTLGEKATCENPQKPLVFIGSSHVCSCAHDANMNQKSFRTRFSGESRDVLLSKEVVFSSELSSLKLSPRAPRGALGGFLVRLWDPP